MPTNLTQDRFECDRLARRLPVNSRQSLGMTSKLSDPQTLRVRIAELRQEIADTTDRYQAAKTRGDSERVIQLLRRRSTLIRELFETQSALLASIRSRMNPSPSAPEQAVPLACT